MCLRSRLVVGIMCICTAAALLSGCGSSGSSAPKDIVKMEEKAGDTAASAVETPDEQEAADVQESPDTDADAAAEDSSKGDITIEEQVLVEQDGIKITALNYVRDDIWGDGIKVLIENDSEQDVMVGCDALIVNDYMIDDLFGSEVAAGKKANDVIYLSSRSRHRRSTTWTRKRMMRARSSTMKAGSGSSARPLTRTASGEPLSFSI